MAERKYISPDASGDGWLMALASSGERIPLPQFLEVEVTRVEGLRTYFIVREGAYLNTEASIVTMLHGRRTLADDRSMVADKVLSKLGLPRENGLVFVEFDKSKRKTDRALDMIEGSLWLGGRPGPSSGTPTGVLTGVLWDMLRIRVVTLEEAPPPAGRQDLEIPDYPHPHGDRYLQFSPYAKTWFRIGHAGDRYLHAGRLSAGCITVDPADWNSVFRFLTRSRMGGGNVGAVDVTIR